MSTKDVATLHKVTAFVTRGDDLLLFRHPHAGIQLPAGTVEEGETPEEAVLREVAEETGLVDVSIAELLLVMEIDLAPDQAVLLESGYLRSTPEDTATLIDERFTRGLIFKVLGVQGKYTRVLYEEYDFRHADPTLLHQQEGWVLSRRLASRLERHLFRLTCHTETPAYWVVDSDRGHRFELFWVPLSSDPGLVVGQDEWLRLVKDKLC
ncbi:MAG: NUDIX domain-containing protein [Ardenticatenales bacterium]|nr:NUDIX domain-containing protein [Ardenticatenales bacterium]